MNTQYQTMLATVLQGERLVTRNSPVRRAMLPEFTITETPLIALRKTAWKKALREFEWFMSGKSKCPDELLDWWDGHLDPAGRYRFGYPTQFRGGEFGYDQMSGLLYGLKYHPNSRRHVITTWNAQDMESITRDNDNLKTPTTCHGSMIQFFVSNETLHMYHYQRSADMLLGLPHNLMQYWSLLLYVAHHTGMEPGQITYKLGDAHIYHEPSHLKAAEEIISAEPKDCDATLLYLPPENPPSCHGIPEFRAQDFKLAGHVPELVCTIRPALL
jgi:thymidylate synthase